MIGFPSVRLDHSDVFPLDLLAEVLGGSQSSMLVEELRDKRQLVSAIEVSDDTPSYDAGTFAIMMELDPEKVGEATSVALEMIETSQGKRHRRAERWSEPRRKCVPRG